MRGYEEAHDGVLIDRLIVIWCGQSLRLDICRDIRKVIPYVILLLFFLRRGSGRASYWSTLSGLPSRVRIPFAASFGRIQSTSSI